MDRERRHASRSKLPDPLPVRIGSMTGRIVDLSPIGARIEHDEKLAIGALVEIELEWSGQRVRIKGRVARSEISGRRGSALVYGSGLHFAELDPTASAVIEEILHGKEEQPATLPPLPPTPPPVSPDPPKSGSMFLPVDDEDTMPFLMLRYRDHHWSKHYTATPQQPDDGLTVARSQAPEIDILQRTYETADPDTRRMMRIAMAAKLGG